MAHQVTERDGMFTVRTPAWHNLQDAVFPDYPTREEAQKIAHNWEPVTEPIFRRIPVITAEGNIEMQYEEIEGFNANVRSDDGHTLGVVADTYEPVLNNTMYDIAEAIEGVDKGSVKYETGGSLKGGSKVWLLLRLAEPILIKGDNGASIPYYALQNSFDGSGSFRGQATFTKIVCDNTAQAADLDASMRGTEFTFRHTKNIGERIEEAQIALAGWRRSIQEWKLLSEHMITVPVTASQRIEFIDTFVPMPAGNIVSDRVRNNVYEARNQIRTILDSETCAGIENTAYGLIQASIEYANHYRRANNQQTRFKRAYLDRSVITADASKIVRELLAV